MKNIFLKFTIVLLSLSVLGCSDFLEQEPGSQISIDEQLATKEGILEALAGLYSNVEATLRTSPYTVYADLQGGNIKFSPVASGSRVGQINVPANLEQVYSFTDTALDSDLDSFYDACYTNINAANLIIENLDTAANLSAEERDQIHAEALVFRGLMHFMLVQVYAQDFNFSSEVKKGIVYKTESLQEELQYAARATLTETYDAIATDFNTALNLFTKTQVLAGPDYSYVNLANAKALLARVYLSQQDWQNAFDLAEDVILTSGVTLTPQGDYVASWEQPLAPISETLLELSVRRDTDGSLGGSLAATYGISSSTSYGDFVASQDLLDLYEADDIRKDMFIEASLPTLEGIQQVNRNYYFTKKFQGEPSTPVIRLSEVYLIAAEAAQQLGRTSDALGYLNAIRERANLPALTDASNLEEFIFLERRRELAFERHLLFDLKRQGRSINRNDGCIAQTCTLNYPSNFFVLPIPQNNINLNANLIQNEGY
ncbi:RagB/SusD family nutrient uptake outer membrane protein [Leeuwenhoekiella sp. W20_SRS_FM14]|uniref:RagB/SusD family nutrient uptake outer membrane protein n=1 Tax=Leeuwenhoekiella sp. W20_SRS_FM14 TaxID=3240270 RepID=UPI003F97FE51